MYILKLSAIYSHTTPTFIHLNSNEYNQVLRYYPFMINLDRCNRSCKVLDNLSNRKCVPKK